MIEINITKIKSELKRDEDFRGKPYHDTKGNLTIGYGRNLTDVGITEYEADFLLMNNISSTMIDLDMGFPHWRMLSEERQRAMVNMAFNLGLPRFLTFVKMLAALREGDFKKASDEALDSLWAKRDVGMRAVRIAEQILNG